MDYFGSSKQLSTDPGCRSVSRMNRFVLNRKEDVSGISGTGLVAEGVEFSDGSVALRWLTSTPSVELLNSVEDLKTIHGHSGSSTIEFLDSQAEDPFAKAITSAMDGYYVSVGWDINTADAVLKSLYVSIDADNAGNKVARAELKDDEHATKDISNKINAGLNLFRDFIKKENGFVIELGGDEGLGKFPRIKVEKLREFAREYKALTGLTLTIGVGKKMSAATKARLLGKLKGKNRVEVWSKASEQELKKLAEEDSEELKKLKESGLI